jgi:potassium efflux system protein
MRLAPILIFTFLLFAAAAGGQVPSPARPASGETPPIDGQVVPVSFQEPIAEAAEVPEITSESIQAELAKVESATDLEDELKQECLTRLGKAKEWLESQREWSSKRQKAEAELAAVPKRVAEVRETLARPVEIPPPELPASATIAQLESRLDEMRGQVESAEANASAKQQATETRAKRLAELAKEILELEKRITETKQQLAGLASTDLLSNTKRTQQLARLRASDEQLSGLKAQRRLLEATSELMPLERDLAVRTASASKKQLQRWQDAVSQWRKQESKRQAKKARSIAEKSHPALRSLAEQNAEIAELRITTAAGIERVAKTLKTVSESSKRLGEQFADLRGKVEHAGATSSTGILLRKQRSDLPDSAEFAERAALVTEEMPKAHLRLMELKQWRRDVADPIEASARVMQTVEESLAAYDSDQVHAVVKRLLSDRRDLLDKLIPDQDTYLQELNELDLDNQSFEQQVSEIREYFDQRVLWMRSNEMLHLSDVCEAISGMKTLLLPSRWVEVIRVARGDLLRRPATGMAVLALFLLVFMFRAKMIATQTRLCEPPLQGQPASFLRYASAFAITFIVSARWPVLLMAFGYRLMFASGTTPWTHSVGAACITTVVFVWGCELIREMSRRNGIGEKLFGWSEEVTASIRGTLELTLLIGTPLFAILQLTQFGDSPPLETLQRLLFITILLVCGFQIGWLARPDGKMMATLMALSPNALVCRLRRPIWIFATAAPLGFAIMSLIGYHFSAYQLSCL